MLQLERSPGLTPTAHAVARFLHLTRVSGDRIHLAAAGLPLLSDFRQVAPQISRKAVVMAVNSGWTAGWEPELHVKACPKP